ncbi:MAG TPA: tryptophan dimethylallyltransferase family protein [Polyangiaceae bacterium]|nr:tryptophan dimethylallyltransferase family protein [Polyangiaceae bacterium]
MQSRADNSLPHPEDASSGTIRLTPRLADLATSRFKALCLGAGYGSDTEAIGATLRRLLAVCGEVSHEGESSEWLSEISDDNTPIEFSVAIADGQAEVRALFEPEGEEPTIAAYREAGLAFNRHLERTFGADLTRFRDVQDLFLPEGMAGPFAVWSSAVFRRGHPPAFKAYFNPNAQGIENAPDLVHEALHRLGLGRAWPSLAQHILARGAKLDELKYFALDLSNEAQARVKVYVRHHAASPEELEFASVPAHSHVPGQTLDFVRAMSGGHARLNARAAFTCSSFSGGADDRPVATTVYVPVCAYARDDARVRQRVRKYLIEQGGDPTLYDSVLASYANRPLEAGVGMQSWVALRRQDEQVRLTVYLATEATRVFEPGEIPAPTGDYSTLVPPPPAATDDLLSGGG